MRVYLRGGSAQTILRAATLRSCRSNFPSHPVTVYWHRANQSKHWSCAWQGSHYANFEVTGMTRPWSNPGASGIRTRDLPLSRRTPYRLDIKMPTGSCWPSTRRHLILLGYCQALAVFCKVLAGKFGMSDPQQFCRRTLPIQGLHGEISPPLGFLFLCLFILLLFCYNNAQTIQMHKESQVFHVICRNAFESYHTRGRRGWGEVGGGGGGVRRKSWV